MRYLQSAAMAWTGEQGYPFALRMRSAIDGRPGVGRSRREEFTDDRSGG